MRVRASVSAARLAPTLWSTVLALLLLGGALGPGYVLSYDMVWVPDLALGRDALGLGTALPRAVPSDAVVAVLDEVVGGMLLQKVVLVAPLVAAGAGAAALVTGAGTVPRLVAASFAVWNPFVVERLTMGHWPVVVGYGVLPWLVLAAHRWRTTPGVPPALPWLLLLGSLSATTGLATAVAALAAGLTRTTRRDLALVVLVLAANLPWVVAGLLHAGSARSAATGADVFATGPEGLLPAPLAALSLGGIWNVEVVPDSRLGWLGVAFTVVVVLLALAGVRRAREVVDRRLLGALLLMWAVGFGVAVLSWAAPGPLGWVAEQLPGGGLLRDGSRLLALALPLTVVLLGHGAQALLARVPDATSRVVLAGALVIWPVTLMPDAALGAAGRLEAVDYPASHEQARTAVASARSGDVLLLPFQSYRAPEWNDHHKVLAPLGRLLGRPVVVNDELVVSGRVLAGEDPRAARVGEALAGATPEARASALRALGIALVVTEEVAGQESPAVAGRRLVATDDLTVVELAGPLDEAAAPRWWRWPMTGAWTGWLLLLGAGVVVLLRPRGSLPEKW